MHMCHRVDTFLSTLSLRRATAPPAPQGKSSIFLSTLSLRRATRETVPRGGHIIFLSTLSLRRATGCQRPCARPTRDFYPRSPCGERRGLMGGSNCDRNFYPRSPCGERHTKHFPALHHILISIHALLAESDAGAGNNAIGISYFYPRSPCGERPANNE